MLYITHKLLNDEQVKDLQRKLLMSPDWIDGKYSAQGAAKEIKKNLQLKLGKSKEELEQGIINVMEEDTYIR